MLFLGISSLIQALFKRLALSTLRSCFLELPIPISPSNSTVMKGKKYHPTLSNKIYSSLVHPSGVSGKLDLTANSDLSGISSHSYVRCLRVEYPAPTPASAPARPLRLPANARAA